jgi:hypothetical protein
MYLYREIDRGNDLNPLAHTRTHARVLFFFLVYFFAVNFNGENLPTNRNHFQTDFYVSEKNLRRRKTGSLSVCWQQQEDENKQRRFFVFKKS